MASLGCSSTLQGGGTGDGAADTPVDDAAALDGPPAGDSGQPAGDASNTPADGAKDVATADQGSPFALQSGKATYYGADGSGNCSFDPSPTDLMVAAMNDEDYDGSRACGACVEVFGPQATIVVRIVDRCPECEKGHIDLSQEAFAQIADVAQGVVPISWRYVACAVSGPVVYKFKEGSNQWWTAVQLRNTRYAVDKLEAEVGGTFQDLGRESYNYFAASGLGPGPYTLRVTDVLGHVLTDTNIVFGEGQQVPGAAQFPP